MAKNNFYALDDLFTLGAPPPYRGDQLNEIRFPLGGIGTGCVSLTGHGGLADWEIFNRPNKGTILPYSFVALWVQPRGQAPKARVLQAPPSPPYSGALGSDYHSFGHSLPRETGAGLPHMRAASFRGEFPFANVLFEEPSLTVQVRLEAYNPFIPLNPDDSGLPVAILRYHIRNLGDVPVSVSLAANLFNPVGYPGIGPFTGNHLGQNRCTFIERGATRGLLLDSDRLAADDPAYGSLYLGTSWGDVYSQDNWLRSGWFDAMHDYWDHFSATGRLPERSQGPSPDGTSDISTLGLLAELGPDESVTLPIMLGWSFPNFTKYWGDPPRDPVSGAEKPRAQWRNYYATRFEDATAAVAYYADHEERLLAETRSFHDALFGSTLPTCVLDAVSSQASILHSPTVIRLEDGTFYGFEGCSPAEGSCEGSCTHVWNYAQTVAFLFPSLERSMREADYTYNMAEDGYMCFRLQLPLGSPLWDFHAAADGQLGGIIKLYRDWKLYGDQAWLARWWPKARQALEYAWQQWDVDQDGVIDGVQHNTYDIEFYGPNSMIGTFYLGALRAAEEMAIAVGDAELAATYRRMFESGRARLDSEIYNGSYYRQQVPLNEHKYQYGEGCLSDQLIGQWLAKLVGLGDLLDPQHVLSALRAIFTHNWRTNFWEHANPQRIYALNDEQGLVLCSWPRGERPTLPFPYSDEVWCGIEYQVASHLIMEGMVQEGLSIVQGVRARHDGIRRNPWNEFECGSHYARSLASWSVLTALSGYEFDIPNKRLGFSPRVWPDMFKCLWSVDSAWGSYEQELYGQEAHIHLSVNAGKLQLASLKLGNCGIVSDAVAAVDGQTAAVCTQARDGAVELVFDPPVDIGAESVLEVHLARS